MFSAAIFDMDGLLIDSERAIMNTWIAVAGELGVTVTPADYLPIIGRSAAECFAMLTDIVGGEAIFREAQPRVRHRLATFAEREGFALKSGAQPLLSALTQAGIPCAVASSSSRAEIEFRLGRAGVLRFFDAIAGGDEVPRGKPDPAVYLLAADRLGARTAECLAFEDSDNGARAATRAGIAVITVPDLKPTSAEIAGLSFKVLTRLDDAIEHVPTWFMMPAASAA